MQSYTIGQSSRRVFSLQTWLQKPVLADLERNVPATYPGRASEWKYSRQSGLVPDAIVMARQIGGLPDSRALRHKRHFYSISGLNFVRIGLHD